MVTAHCEGISGGDKWTLVNVAEAVFDLCEISEYQATLVLVSDDDIRSLNKEFRGLDEVTDVLSFSNAHGGQFYGPESSNKFYSDTEGFVLPDEFSHQIGEVLISLRQAERQAVEEGVTLLAELKLLVAHGFLHLLGYDHMEEEEESVMKELERRVIDSVNKHA